MLLGERRIRARGCPSSCSRAVSILRSNSWRLAASPRTANCAPTPRARGRAALPGGRRERGARPRASPRRARPGVPGRPGSPSCASKRASVCRAGPPSSSICASISSSSSRICVLRCVYARRLGEADDVEVLACALRAARAASRGSRRGALRRRCSPPRRARRRRLRRLNSAWARAWRQVLDFLLAREHAGLLGIGRVELTANWLTACPSRVMMTSPWVRPRARCQRFVEVARGVDAFEPVTEQGRQAGVAEVEQVGEARQGLVRGSDAPRSAR